MGYTTRFDGGFSLIPSATEEDAKELYKTWDDGHAFDFPCPDGYCQWQISKDGARLAWDGNEKFYHYEEWLRALVEGYFSPRGITVAGSVTWQGEDISDRGVLSVVNGKVAATKEEDRKVAANATARLDFLVEKIKRDVFPLLDDRDSGEARRVLDKALAKVGAT